MSNLSDKFTQRPAEFCNLVQTTPQSIPSGVYTPAYTPCYFDYGEGSRADWWDAGNPHRITVTESGFYLVEASFSHESHGSGEYEAIGYILHNNDLSNNAGTIATMRVRCQYNASAHCGAVVYLEAGDWVHSAIYQSTGANRDTSPAVTHFFALRL